MKKITALCLCLVLLAASLSSCLGRNREALDPTGSPTAPSAIPSGTSNGTLEASEERTEATAGADNASLPPTEEATEEATEEPTDAPTVSEPTEEKTEAPSESGSETDVPTEAPTEHESGTDTGSGENTQEGGTQTGTGDEADTTPIGSLDEELASLGITGYDAAKLYLISLYYNLYYIGGDLPDARTLARSIDALFLEYFAELDRSDAEAMTTAVIACYQMAVGDRYATYFDEESYREQKTDQDAEFVGIGVYVSYDLRENTVQVLSVFKGTPAAEAGILPGDYLVAVDGVSIDEIGYAELVNRIRGEVDSSVTVLVERDGQRLSFTMQRKPVEGVSVTYRQLSQDENVGYVKIEQFDSKTAAQFRHAIDELLLAGVEGLIFDVRGNPGGEVNSIVDVLDYLLADGLTIARFRYDEDLSALETVYTGNDGHEVTLPMVVLCDAYTASAGELFTAALRDHGVATVIGVTTYGKGTAQNLIELQDGTAFTISTARYDPPSGENYEGVGITPHIVVELDEAAASVNAFLRDDAIDNQLQAGVRELDRLRDAALQ